MWPCHIESTTVQVAEFSGKTLESIDWSIRRCISLYQFFEDIGIFGEAQRYGVGSNGGGSFHNANALLQESPGSYLGNITA